MSRPSDQSGISTAIFDLETSNLSGDRGIILCGVIKSSSYGTIVVRSDRTNPGWKKGLRENDKETVVQLVKALEGHDILVAHNGTRFDLPFLRTRLARWGLPSLPNYKVIDPLSIAWRKLRLESNSLGRIADTIGLKERKTPLDMSVWLDATLNGTKASMDLIVQHCKADVEVLDGVLQMVKPYVKVLDDRGSAL